jgi:hypothetical protein
VVTTHTLFCLRTSLGEEISHFVCGVFNSLVMNLVVRLLMGSHVTTTLAEQLPVPRWTGDERQRRIAGLARRLASGGAPGLIAARVDAEVARMFGITRDEYGRILEGFPLVADELRSAAFEEFARGGRGDGAGPKANASGP